MEGVLFLCSLALCVVTGVLFFKFEAKDYKQATAAVDDVKGDVTAVENLQKKYVEEQKAFAITTVDMLADLNKRLREMETKKQEPREINLNLKEPVRFQVVYKTIQQPIPPRIPDPPQFTGKKATTKTPLLDKVGITHKAPTVNQ